MFVLDSLSTSFKIYFPVANTEAEQTTPGLTSDRPWWAPSQTMSIVISLLLLVGTYYKTFASSEQCSCENTTKCDYSNRCDPNLSDCRKVNVALGKKANMSSVYNGGPGMAGPACLAVNGNRSHVFVPLNNSNTPNCVHSDERYPDEMNTSWEVDLNGTFTILDITIYLRNESIESLANAKINVNGKMCYNFSGKKQNLVEKIKCQEPLRGKKVRVTKTAGILVFCELEVWVCSTGRYGPSCEDTCSEHCRHKATCDNYDGTCHEGCEDGYYDNLCTKECSKNCKNKKCNQTSGNCLEGCESGWNGTTCNTKCDPGTFGLGCREHCGKCKISCNHISGHCDGGCVAGYTFPYCNATCSNSTYGENCAQTCGYCADSEPCNITSGHCRECQEGHDLPFCKSEDRSNTSVVAGVTVVAVLLLLVIFVIIFVVIRKKRRWFNQSDFI